MVLQLLLQLMLLLDPAGRCLYLALLQNHPVNARDVGKTVERWMIGDTLLTCHALTFHKQLVLKCFGHPERTSDQLVIKLLLESGVVHERLVVDIYLHVLVVGLRGAGLGVASIGVHRVVHHDIRHGLLGFSLLRLNCVALMHNKILFEPTAEKLAEDKVLRDSTCPLLESIVIKVCL